MKDSIFTYLNFPDSTVGVGEQHIRFPVGQLPAIGDTLQLDEIYSPNEGRFNVTSRTFRQSGNIIKDVTLTLKPIS